MNPGFRLRRLSDQTFDRVDQYLPERVSSTIEEHNHWLYLIPTFLFYIPFVIFPIAFIFFLSVHTNNISGTRELVGLEFYSRTVQDQLLYTVAFHNLAVLAINMFFHTVVALGVAIAIRKAHDRLQSFFQTAVLLPVGMMSVGVALIWRYMYHPNLGLINEILASLNIGWEPVWLGNASLALISVTLATNWWWFGFWVVIWLVGLGSVDDKYNEAAEMDGANRLQAFRYVTLPLLKDTGIFVVLLTTINAIKIFGLFWVMTQGGPGRASEVFLTWIYKLAFSVGSFGRAAAVTVLMFVLIMVFTIMNLKISGETA